MRPVRLTVAGMRSYRAQRTLSFEDRSLMAILGDTGSGKSSILEAIFGALYGGSTWDARGLGPLIADGVKTLQIELEFTARGKTYTVARAASRGNYPPAKHVLDGPDGEHLDGATAVNSRIVQIVGLTDQEFLRVVILPQGQFGRLLQGTPGERIPILRGILGLGVLDRVREVADRQGTELAAALTPLTAARARLYPDPSAVAATALKERDKQSRIVKKLAKASESLDSADRAVASLRQALPSIKTALDDASGIELAEVVRVLTLADELAAAADAEADRLNAERQGFQDAEDDHKAEITSAEAAGFSAVKLALMSASLKGVVDNLPGLQQDSRNQQNEAAAIAKEAAALEDAAAAAGQAADLSQHAQSALHALEVAAGAANDAFNDARAMRGSLEKLTSGLTRDREKLAPASASVIDAALALRACRDALAQARGAEADADERLAELKANNLAAHVARLHSAGDPCPVCDRELPPDFLPPEVVGEQELVEAKKTASAGCKAEEKAEREAERALDAARYSLVSRCEDVVDVSVQIAELLDPSACTTSLDLEQCTAVIESAVSRLLEDDASPDPEATRESALALVSGISPHLELPESIRLASESGPSLEALVEEKEARQAVWKTAQEEASKLATTATSLAAELRAATKQLEKRRTQHDQAMVRTHENATRQAKEILALPPMISEPLSATLKLSAADPGSALLVAPALPTSLVADLEGKLAAKERELAGFIEGRDAAHREALLVDKELAALAEQRRLTVEQPRSKARASWHGGGSALRNLLASLPSLDTGWKKLASAITIPDLPERLVSTIGQGDPEPEDAELTAAVAALAERLGYATELAETTVSTVENGIEAAATEASRVLGSVDVQTRKELAELLADAGHLQRMASATYDRAILQEPLATGLDVGLKALRTRCAILREVKDLLSPSAFPQFVVEQRQIALLRIASSLLAKLTRDGYGFGENFMIVDRRTGQPRHAKTLSGGETFLASLALALALVEISNRSGGQLECLFLDEGFGSLDASILGEALDVLRTQTTGGRLVGVISHLHAVAAELDDVLVVTKEVEGSDFRWLDAEERDQYLLDETAAGLLT